MLGYEGNLGLRSSTLGHYFESVQESSRVALAAGSPGTSTGPDYFPSQCLQGSLHFPFLALSLAPS